ncbi:hypothetical protein EJV44_15365 [Ancylobacter aquaticus]|nr:hypothetical protein EJV44_15365 [Ancylobacter aquaticus]
MLHTDVSPAASARLEVHPDMPRQLALEERMRSLGVERFWENVRAAEAEGRQTETLSVRRVLNAGAGKMVEAIESFMEAAFTGAAGRLHAAADCLATVEPELAAFLTLRVVLDNLSARPRLQTLAYEVGILIEDETRFRFMKEGTPGLYHWARRKVVEASENPKYRRRVLLHYQRKLGQAWEDWSRDKRISLGVKLIELMIGATGLVARESVNVGARAMHGEFIVPVPETADWVRQENERCEALLPIYLPTIIPPRPWTSPTEGGYWSGRVRRLHLIKTGNRAYLEELAELPMETVYRAVNAMQDTAWAVNIRVLDVMEKLYGAGSGIAGLPSPRNEPEPERPHDVAETMPWEDMTEDQQARMKAWKREAARVKGQNKRVVGRRIGLSKLTNTAREFAGEEAIYFPYQLDFRGRAYAVPLYLNPQGDDRARGLLLFSNTVPIADAQGAGWLAVHGAGLWGVDKKSMEERIDWVYANQAAILASAEDPFDNRFWADAEKPWQALAFCFEWAGFVREGFDYESALPVQMDGTCNGLQNFSAMLRDPIGGKAVNLVPSDEPNDIYQQVADIVSKQVMQDAAKDIPPELRERADSLDEKEAKAAKAEIDRLESARGWVGLINRKVTKRPVMTLPYGAKLFGFTEQIYEDTVKPLYEANPSAFPWGPKEADGWPAASYMARLTWDAVGQVVVAARHTMDWLQGAASAVAKQGLPVRWTTPAGLVAQQDYRQFSGKRLELTFQEVRLRLQVRSEKEDIDTRRMASAIAPNFVHSLDAAHMQGTVVRCLEAGIRSYSLIHDSYGTHAGNAAVMAHLLREEFIAMYTPNVLLRLKTELEDQLPEGMRLPPLPPMGDLDLSVIRESRFFFA